MVCETSFVGSYSIGFCSKDDTENPNRNKDLINKKQEFCLYDENGKYVAGPFESCSEAKDYYFQMCNQSDEEISMEMR